MDTSVRHLIRKALDRDGLAEAEKTTGQRWNDNPAVTALGMLNHMEIAKQRDELLMLTDDSTFSNTLERYLDVIGKEGFEQVLCVPFAGRQTSENLFIYWHPRDGILLRFDTYGGDHINGGHFYYNIWLDPKAYNARSSGQFVTEPRDDGKRLWVGDHDCREAIRFNIQTLRNHGEFIPKWQKRPFLWLLHYMDNEKHGIVNERRIAMLPQHVRDAITPSGANE